METETGQTQETAPSAEVPEKKAKVLRNLSPEERERRRQHILRVHQKMRDKRAAAKAATAESAASYNNQQEGINRDETRERSAVFQPESGSGS